MNIMPSSRSRTGQTAKSAALVVCGVAMMARYLLAGQGAVLAFHGLRADREPTGVLDESLHLPISVFRNICQHLAAKYHVMPLAEMATTLAAGEKLPSKAVAITFDDGFASNYELGFPVLREFGLPATIFLATGFLDRTYPLWFQQVDQAMGSTQAATAESLTKKLTFLKTLSDEDLRSQVQNLVQRAGDTLLVKTPTVTRALTWDQVRKMQATGLITFGGHTHTHPILARCSLEQQKKEIETCRDRIQEELGVSPTLFAFPNGGAGDHSPETLRLLKDAGFTSAWTMVHGRASAKHSIMEMPRYGAPESVWETEATVSGGFELLRQWRGGAA
jgi:peptidoglycan/xylan/chitin deacetylase (PgdA/CDA1 family)